MAMTYFTDILSEIVDSFFSVQSTVLENKIEKSSTPYYIFVPRTGSDHS